MIYELVDELMLDEGVEVIDWFELFIKKAFWTFMTVMCVVLIFTPVFGALMPFALVGFAVTGCKKEAPRFIREHPYVSMFGAIVWMGLHIYITFQFIN